MPKDKDFSIVPQPCEAPFKPDSGSGGGVAINNRQRTGDSAFDSVNQVMAQQPLPTGEEKPGDSTRPAKK